MPRWSTCVEDGEHRYLWCRLSISLRGREITGAIQRPTRLSAYLLIAYEHQRVSALLSRLSPDHLVAGTLAAPSTYYCLCGEMPIYMFSELCSRLHTKASKPFLCGTDNWSPLWTCLIYSHRQISISTRIWMHLSLCTSAHKPDTYAMHVPVSHSYSR